MFRPGTRPVKEKLQTRLSCKSRTTLQIGLSDNYLGLLLGENEMRETEAADLNAGLLGYDCHWQRENQRPPIRWQLREVSEARREDLGAPR